MKVEKMISQLDGACGRLIVASMSNKEVAEAMQMVTKVSIALGDLGYEMESKTIEAMKKKYL